MKKILYSILIILGVGAMPSCSDDKDIFDDSAANRMSAALKEYQEVLVNAPNGWVMEYYFDVEPTRMGGYNYLCSFDEDLNVVFATEVSVNEYAPGDKVKSTYNLVADQGPVLTFDTYNELFHIFSEPQGSGNPFGDMGDYEFVLMEVSPEKIVLEGKRYGNKIVMTPLPQNQDWTEYLEKVASMADKNYYPCYQILVSNSQKGVVYENFDTRLFSFGDEENPKNENVIYTPTGFKFYAPVEVEGIKVENFTWDDSQKAFICAENNSVVLKGFYPEGYKLYNDYIGTYDAEYTNLNGEERIKVGRVSSLVDGESYRVSGIASFDFVMRYDRTSGQIIVDAQYMEDYGPYEIYMYMWLGGYSISTSYRYIGVPNDDASVITFESSDPASAHVGMILIADLDGALYLNGPDNAFENLVMTKK